MGILSTSELGSDRTMSRHSARAFPALTSYSAQRRNIHAHHLSIVSPVTPWRLYRLLCFIALAFAPSTTLAQNPLPANSLDSIAATEVLNGKVEMVTYRGRYAVHLVPSADHDGPQDAVLAIVRSSDLGDGIIEADVAGAPRQGAPADSRGFIGISFHVHPHGSRFETFYLRPTNGRADDQLRRNHSAQYVSEPDFPWQRLRQENPGVYESYVDLEPGAWTKMKIEIAGTTARLYVNGAAQPCLIVNDLKMGKAQGQVALWIHSSTDGYFSNLRIRPAEAHTTH